MTDRILRVDGSEEIVTIDNNGQWVSWHWYRTPESVLKLCQEAAEALVVPVLAIVRFLSKRTAVTHQKPEPPTPTGHL